ncbi:hypothetical protein XPA_002722 [Xanthoria parietina]
MLYASSILLSAAALFSVVHLAPISTTGVAIASGAVACILLCGSDDDDDNASQPSTDTTQSSSAASPYGDPNPAQLTCSTPNDAGPGTNPQIVPGSADAYSWATSMVGCLGKLNDEDWMDSQKCEPSNGNGTIIGQATFNFYSKGVKWDEPRDCYHKCGLCLEKNVRRLTGADASCHYDAGGGSSCDMGFVKAQ